MAIFFARREPAALRSIRRYRILERSMLPAHGNMPPRDVLWVETPAARLRADLSKLERGVFSRVALKRFYGFFNESTGEGWIIVPGKTTFTAWPDPNQWRTIPGTERHWSTVLYAHPEK